MASKKSLFALLLLLAGNALASGSGVKTEKDRVVFSKAGAVSAPTLSLTGAPYTGGTATTTKPLLLIEPTGATSSAWHTSGTLLGANAASGFTGNLTDIQLNGVSKFAVTYTGAIYANALSITATGMFASANNVTLNIGTGRTYSSASQTQVKLANQSDTSSSGIGTAVAITPTWNQTGTAGGTDLLINRTQTAVGSGSHKLIDAQVGSASKFSVDNQGVVTAKGFAGPLHRAWVGDREEFINWNTQSQRLTYGNSGGSVAGFDATANVPNSDHPGVWKYTSTAATNWMNFVATAGNANIFSFGTRETVYEAMVYLSHLSDATDAYTLMAGWNNGTSNYINTYGAAFSYTHSANSGQWQCITKTAGGGTSMTNSSSAVAAATWYRLTISIINGSGTFYVNGTPVCSGVTANIPADGYASSVEPWAAWVRSAGTNSRYVIWDYIAWGQENAR